MADSASYYRAVDARPCRLVLVVAAGEPGGLERLLAQICEGVAARGAAVDLVRVPNRRDTVPSPLAATLPVRSVTDILSSQIEDMRRGVLAVLRRAPADVACFVGGWAITLADTARIAWPLAHVVTMQLNALDGLASNRIMAAMVDRVVVESHAVAAALVGAGETGDRIVVVPSGIDLAAFGPGPRDAALAARMGLRPGMPVVAYAGRLSAEKGPLDFVAAASMLAERDVELAMIGDGPSAQAVERAIDAAGLTGRIRRYRAAPEEMPAIHRLIDVMVIPSRMDGRPQAAMEAMATGTAVVATDVGGIPELIEDAVDGHLRPAAAPALLAEAAGALIDAPDTRTRIGAAARRRARAAFDMRRNRPQLAHAILGAPAP
ncbi:MAG: glycosyltransferase [Alphaproteobacteria bacterium]